MTISIFKRIFLFIPVMLALGAGIVQGQTTEFTYQGRLTDGAVAPTAVYDFEFRLFANDTGGTPPLGTIQRTGVQVASGIFTVRLDFGANFDGPPRFLEIAVKAAGSPNPYTVLAPRQPLTSAPYAVRSLNSSTAETAANSLSLGGVAAGQFVQSGDARLSDDRNPLPNSPNYINNTTAPQSASNFNISGSGTASAFNALTQFNINGSRVLSIGGVQNVFAGIGAGASNPTGGGNAFFGSVAGQANTSGDSNAFFGSTAGQFNTTARANAFFGANAGRSSNGNDNAFFGTSAGLNNTTGTGNTFIGRTTGLSNTVENNNTFVGFLANGAAGITNATAIGANALVTTSNTMVLGTGAVTVQIPGAANVAGTLGANVLNAATQFDIGGSRVLSVAGNLNIFAGIGAGNSNTTGQNNAFFGTLAGDSNTTGSQNSFFGYKAGQATTIESQNSFFGVNAGRSNTAEGNSFFGVNAGFGNTTGTGNAFFGLNAGQSNVLGNNNSFFGLNSGTNNSGDANSFFGALAGQGHGLGNGNSFFGYSSGFSALAGSQNSFFGSRAGFTTEGSNNSFFGYKSGFGNVSGGNNAYYGVEAGVASTSSDNSFFGYQAGTDNTTGEKNTFVGENSGQFNRTGGWNTAIGYNATFNQSDLFYATAIGADSRVLDNATIALGRTNGADRVVVYGLGTSGITSLCRNAQNQIATCSSSLRYKTNVETYAGGLEIVRRLRPISFDWKNAGPADVGFAAEEVDQIEPRLTTRNAQGEIEGVKYGQLTTVLVNAVNEQQRIIERQQRQIDALKKLVCAQNPGAEICREEENK
ncbi:MAG: tail fiber domain-containing protein [Acidobacteria bacterium]|nr:tail fiber domain-containing protein [Acidobacteriota bacterium]